jgi:hypothetical protein
MSLPLLPWRGVRAVIDEVERVLDLVRDAGGQLPERGHFLGLDQARLRSLQVQQANFRIAPLACPDLVERRCK